MLDIFVDVMVLIIFVVPLVYCWGRLLAYMNNHRIKATIYIVVATAIVGIHLAQSRATTVIIYPAAMAICGTPTSDSPTDDYPTTLTTTTVNPRDQRRLHYESWVVIEPMKEPILHRNVGDRVELECEARGSPPPVIQWIKRDIDRQLSINQDFPETTGPYAIAKVKSRLVLPHILPIHHGVYRCVAHGTVDKFQDVNLNIVDKEGRDLNFTQMVQQGILGAYRVPRVAFWATFYMDDMGHDIVLPCMMAGNPLPTRTWVKHSIPSKDAEPITENDHYKFLSDGALKIIGLKWDDLGIFTCMLKNDVGTDTANTFVYPFLHDTNSQFDEFLSSMQNDDVIH